LICSDRPARRRDRAARMHRGRPSDEPARRSLRPHGGDGAPVLPRVSRGTGEPTDDCRVSRLAARGATPGPKHAAGSCLIRVSWLEDTPDLPPIRQLVEARAS
jgi:hypothetical protein